VTLLTKQKSINSWSGHSPEHHSSSATNPEGRFLNPDDLERLKLAIKNKIIVLI
jgi:hypothetical protein